MTKRTFQQSVSRLQLRIGDVNDLINVLGDQTQGVVLPIKKAIEVDEEKKIVEQKIAIEGDDAYAETIIELGPEWKDCDTESNK